MKVELLKSRCSDLVKAININGFQMGEDKGFPWKTECTWEFQHPIEGEIEILEKKIKNMARQIKRRDDKIKQLTN